MIISVLATGTWPRLNESDLRDYLKEDLNIFQISSRYVTKTEWVRSWRDHLTEDLYTYTILYFSLKLKLNKVKDNKYFSSRCLTKAKSVRHARLPQRGFEYFQVSSRFVTEPELVRSWRDHLTEDLSTKTNFIFYF